jgi:hypothetical protein
MPSVVPQTTSVVQAMLLGGSLHGIIIKGGFLRAVEAVNDSNQESE